MFNSDVPACMNFKLIFFPVETRETLKEILQESVYDSLVEECHCIICGHFLGVASNLEEHFTDHMCLTDLTCQACPWKSSELKTLVNHVRKQHRKFYVSRSCMECKINFPGKIEREKHWKEKHEYHKCILCDFATDFLPTLASHVEAKHSDSSHAEGKKPNNI